MMPLDWEYACNINRWCARVYEHQTIPLKMGSEKREAVFLEEVLLSFHVVSMSMLSHNLVIVIERIHDGPKPTSLNF